MTDSIKCPFCQGTGNFQELPIYVVSVNDYVSMNSDGTDRHRIRLEIKQADVDKFLDRHEHGQSLIIVPLDDLNSHMEAEAMAKELENLDD